MVAISNTNNTRTNSHTLLLRTHSKTNEGQFGERGNNFHSKNNKRSLFGLDIEIVSLIYSILRWPFRSYKDY